MPLDPQVPGAPDTGPTLPATGADPPAVDHPGGTQLTDAPSTGTILPANTQLPVRVGQAVFGSDSEPIGWVKEVRATDFLVDRPRARDMYVPLDAVIGEDT